MDFEADATIPSKGQITVPAGVREKLGVRAGDRLRFHLTKSGKLTVTPIHRRSIFDRLDELKLPSIGRPVTREDIDAAVGEAMEEQERRIRNQRRRR
jgi:AbrB family looped-hinge helix DNA binding protein